MKNSFAKVFKI